MSSRGDAADGEGAIVTSLGAESGTFDNYIDACKRLQCRAVEHLSADGARGFLGAEGIE